MLEYTADEMRRIAVESMRSYVLDRLMSIARKGECKCEVRSCNVDGVPSFKDELLQAGYEVKSSAPGYYMISWERGGAFNQ